ncbi:MAG: hypothetical protein IJ262_05620 [Clostridia bacterium]|nr:hypothetical protein [Clostridia bacterium]
MADIKAFKNSKINFKLIKRVIIAVVAIVVICFVAVYSAINFSKAAEYRSAAEEASSVCEDIKQDISEKNELIKGEGFDEYCEKIAREDYGYAKPGEYVIYDSSFGE